MDTPTPLTRFCFPFILFVAFLFITVDQAQAEEVNWLVAEKFVKLDGAGVTPFKKTVAGDLFGNMMPDVAVLQGATVYMCAAPSLISDTSTNALSLAVNAMDLLPNGGKHSDAIVTAGPTGIHLVTWDHDTDEFETDQIAAYQDAHLVEVADMNLDGKDNIVLVSHSSGVSVIRILKENGGTWSVLEQFSINDKIKDIELLRWKGGASFRYIALIRESAGLGVYEPDGDLVFSNTHLSQPDHPDSLAHLKTLSGADLLVWVTSYEFYPDIVEQSLIVCGFGYTATSTYIGTMEAIAANPLDANKDGKTDILLPSRKILDQQVILINQGSEEDSFVYSNQAPHLDFLITSEENLISTAEAVPVVFDFEGDGDKDVIYPVVISGIPKLGVYRNNDNAHLTFAPQISSMEWTVDTVSGSGTADMVVPPASSIPSGMTHLEVMIFVQETDQATTLGERLTMTSTAIVYELHDLSGVIDNQFQVDFPLTEGMYLAVGHQDTTLYNILLRYVMVVGQKVVQASPYYPALFTTETAMDNVKNYSKLYEIDSLPVNIGDPEGHGVGGENGSITAPTGNMIPFSSGDPPDGNGANNP